MSQDDLLEQWPKRWIGGAASWPFWMRGRGPKPPPDEGAILTEDDIDITTEDDEPIVIERIVSSA